MRNSLICVTSVRLGSNSVVRVFIRVGRKSSAQKYYCESERASAPARMGLGLFESARGFITVFPGRRRVLLGWIFWAFFLLRVENTRSAAGGARVPPSHGLVFSRRCQSG